ncbi:hypothetical protein ACVXHA_18050, partial [Escherichia coli]
PSFPLFLRRIGSFVFSKNQKKGTVMQIVLCFSYKTSDIWRVMRRFLITSIFRCVLANLS